MGQYHKLVNIDKKEYVDPYEIGILAKQLEQIGYEGSLSDVLYLLNIAQGNNDRGGGDVSGSPYFGRWAGDRCVVVGDYYTEKSDDPRFKDLYDKVDHKKSGYTNIAPQVRKMLEAVFDFNIKKEYWTVKELDGSIKKTPHWERVDKKNPTPQKNGTKFFEVNSSNDVGKALKHITKISPDLQIRKVK